MDTARIKSLLLWWAELHRQQSNGYPAASSIAQFRDGAGKPAFASKPPRGVEVPEAIRRLQEAMEFSKLNGCAQEIAAIECLYKAGLHKSTEVSIQLGIGETKLRMLRQTGESVLAVLMANRERPASNARYLQAAR